MAIMETEYLNPLNPRILSLPPPWQDYARTANPPPQEGNHRRITCQQNPTLNPSTHDNDEHSIYGRSHENPFRHPFCHLSGHL